jgi:hypothetical protein
MVAVSSKAATSANLSIGKATLKAFEWNTGIPLGDRALSEEAELTLPHSQLPTELGEYLDKLILTYHRLGKPSTSKEFADKNKDLGKSTIVGRGLPFLSHLGIMKVAKRGNYDLAPAGQPIRTALVSEDEERARQAWQTILLEHKLFDMTKEYLGSEHGTGTAVGLGSYVNNAAKKGWGKRFTEDGGRRFCSLLRSKGLIDYDEKTGNFSLRDVGKQELKREVETPERVLLHVEMTSTGKLNITVSDELDNEISRKIVDMVLGARKTTGRAQAR